MKRIFPILFFLFSQISICDDVYLNDGWVWRSVLVVDTLYNQIKIKSSQGTRKIKFENIFWIKIKPVAKNETARLESYDKNLLLSGSNSESILSEKPISSPEMTSRYIINKNINLPVTLLAITTTIMSWSEWDAYFLFKNNNTEKKYLTKIQLRAVLFTSVSLVSWFNIYDSDPVKVDISNRKLSATLRF